MLIEHLAYDKRTDSRSSRGLSLVRDLPRLNLLKGDRVEPCQAMPNVADVFSVTAYPVDILFWRPALETLARHRNPLFDDEVGLSVHEGLTIDPLHALYLGVMKDLLMWLIWTLIDDGFWGYWGTADETLDRVVSVVMAELSSFYKRWDQSHPDSAPLTRLSTLTAKMLGDHSHPKIENQRCRDLGCPAFFC